MAKEEKIEGNLLISKFMGAKPIRERSAKVFEVENGLYFPMDCPSVPKGLSMHDRPYFEAKDLYYHQDWESLMSVVNKIEEKSTPYFVEIVEDSCYIYNIDSEKPIVMTKGETKRQAVWKAVVELIKQIK